MSTGISAANGEFLAEMDHIRQSIQDILLTRIGERIMRREYGSWLFYLVDAPMDPVTIMDIYAASIGAIRRWEPRVKVIDIQAIQPEDSGRLTLSLSAIHKRTGAPISLADLRFA